MRITRTSWLQWLIAGLIACRAITLSAQSANEAALKVALIYNFALFVDWPQDKDRREAPAFYLCFAGDDGLGTSVAVLESKTLRGRKVIVRRLRASALDDTCDVLFIASSEKSRLHEITNSLQGKSVLTISDADAAARSGAVIGLDIENQKMVFDINIQAAKRQGLAISSKLLRLSRSVIE